MGGNPIQLDYTVLLTLFIPMLFSLFFFIFVVYLILSALRFFKRKAIFDKEVLLKLDELIKLHTEQTDKRS